MSEVNINKCCRNQCDLTVEGSITDSLLDDILDYPYRVVDLTNADMSGTYQVANELLSCTGCVVKSTKRKRNSFISLLEMLRAELVILPDTFQPRNIKSIRNNPQILKVYVTPTSHNLYMDGEIVKSNKTNKILFDPSTRIIPENVYRSYLNLYEFERHSNFDDDRGEILYRNYPFCFYIPHIFYNEEGKMGVKDCTGKTIIEAIYDNIYFVSGCVDEFPHIIECSIDSKIHIYNHCGEFFTDADATWPHMYSDYALLFEKNSKWGCVYAPDKLLPAIYDRVYNSPYGVMLKQNGLTGMLNFSDLTYYSPKFDGIYDDNFANEVAYLDGKKMKLAQIEPDAINPIINIRDKHQIIPK